METDGMRTKRVKLTVAYDGTNYHGWQFQKNAVTIEEVLNQALTELLGEPIAVIGASRTDSGVHAMGNVAIFDTVNRMPVDRICLALNQRLPEDIRVQESVEVPAGWHPRKCRCTKTYEYRILNRRIDMPVCRLYSHFCYTLLDVEAMRRAAVYLVGEHNYKSFCTAKSEAEDTVRTIYSLDVEQFGEQITIRVSGSGFLYNMVRIIAGTLMDAGKGLYPPEEMANILAARNRQAAGPTALAKGLTLVSLVYEPELEAWLSRENREWSYNLLQSHIRADRCAFFMIGRCADEEWEGILYRNIHQAVRDGAEAVYLIDLEKDRLKTGDIYGYYHIRGVPDMGMVMDLLTGDESETVREICRGADRDRDAPPVWFLACDSQKPLNFLDFSGKKC